MKDLQGMKGLQVVEILRVKALEEEAGGYDRLARIARAERRMILERGRKRMKAANA